MEGRSEGAPAPILSLFRHSLLSECFLYFSRSPGGKPQFQQNSPFTSNWNLGGILLGTSYQVTRVFLLPGFLQKASNQLARKKLIPGIMVFNEIGEIPPKKQITYTKLKPVGALFENINEFCWLLQFVLIFDDLHVFWIFDHARNICFIYLQSRRGLQVYKLGSSFTPLLGKMLL